LDHCVQEGIRLLLQGFPDLHLTTAEIRGSADRLRMLTQLGILPDIG
jgi:hypothetical protein